MRFSSSAFLLVIFSGYVESRSSPSLGFGNLPTAGLAAPIPPGVQCAQTRQPSDPSASAISSAFASASAVADACNIFKDKSSIVKEKIGDLDITSWNLGSYFFNISSSSLSQSLETVPPSWCPDHFKNIINTCIKDSGSLFWGGWVDIDGGKFSISNAIYPKDPLSPAVEPIRATITSVTSTDTVAPADLSTQAITSSGLTANAWLTTSQGGHTTIVPVIVGCPGCGGLDSGIIVWNLPPKPNVAFSFPKFPKLPTINFPCTPGSCSSPPVGESKTQIICA